MDSDLFQVFSNSSGIIGENACTILVNGGFKKYKVPLIVSNVY